jgi:transcriptional regulator with XRE-family HTH domain
MSKDDGLIKLSKDIGNNLLKRRKEKNISAYRLSINSGIHSSLISKIEKGERDLQISTILKYLKGLDISASDFFKDFDYSYL